MSEIEFLTLYASPGMTVIYVGSAPGTHLRYLSALFPHLRYVLVDPAKFHIRERANIEIRNEFFTDDLAVELAKRYASSDMLFISDVRERYSIFGGPMNEEGLKLYENIVQKDMTSQRRWYELLGKPKSLLKFRLPYLPGQTEYLDGDIYFQTWGGLTTTETRIVPNGKVRVYDHDHYADRMFYFNTVQRMKVYAHQVASDDLDHCYDCAAEIHVLRQFLVSRFQDRYCKMAGRGCWSPKERLLVSQGELAGLEMRFDFAMLHEDIALMSKEITKLLTTAVRFSLLRSDPLIPCGRRMCVATENNSAVPTADP